MRLNREKDNATCPLFTEFSLTEYARVSTRWIIDVRIINSNNVFSTDPPSFLKDDSNYHHDLLR